jgi:hypothetical protein
MASHGGDDNDASWWLNPANFQSAGTILFTTTVVTVVVVSGIVWRVFGKGRPNNYRDMTEQYHREFKGKTIIVTGANSGVGKSL